VSLHKFCHQLITGDSTDNIPGCFRAGAAAARSKYYSQRRLRQSRCNLKNKAFYISWHTVVYKKEAVKQEKKNRKL
jgi:hypothetical protein